MLSLKKCKKTLNKKGVKYTDEEVKIIREIIYDYAYLEYELFPHIKEKK